LYVKMTNEQLIRDASGTSLPICRYENTTLDPSIVLKYGIYVPQLINNLISIKKLTKYLNCSVAFFFYCYCVY